MSRDFNIHDYSDIRDMPRPVFASRKKMSMAERGAQFSPFAALTGYEEAVEEEARLTDRESVLTEDSKAELDVKLQVIADHLDDLPEVAVTHFVPDARKVGGAYRVTVGIIREMDAVEGCLLMMDRQKIPIRHIRDISGALFSGLFE